MGACRMLTLAELAAAAGGRLSVATLADLVRIDDRLLLLDAEGSPVPAGATVGDGHDVHVLRRIAGAAGGRAEPRPTPVPSVPASAEEARGRDVNAMRRAIREAQALEYAPAPLPGGSTAHAPPSGVDRTTARLTGRGLLLRVAIVLAGAVALVLAAASPAVAAPGLVSAAGLVSPVIPAAVTVAVAVAAGPGVWLLMRHRLSETEVETWLLDRALRQFRLGYTSSWTGFVAWDFVVPLIAHQVLGASVGWVGGLVFVTFAADLLSLLPAGAVLERVSKRRATIYVELGRIAVLTTIAAAAWFDALALWQLYVAVGVQAVLTGTLRVAGGSYVTILAGRADRIDLTRNRLDTDLTVAMAAGALFAGLFAGRFGTLAVVAVVPVLFALNAVVLAASRDPSPGSRRSVREVREE